MGWLVFILRENGRRQAIELGRKTTGEEQIFKIVRSMIGDNHPVGADTCCNVVLHGRKGWLARWLKESTAEDSLEALRGDIFRVIGQMEKYSFFVPNGFGRMKRLGGSAFNGISKDGAESFRAVALGDEAAEEGMIS
jgi:hypothetical protein